MDRAAGSWILGSWISWILSWAMGPSHHTTNHTATTQVAHCRSVDWGGQMMGERPTRRLAWSCGGDVFNGGVRRPPARSGSTMESCRRETAMSLDCPALTLILALTTVEATN